MTESISLVVSHSSFQNDLSVGESVSEYVPSDDSSPDVDNQEVFYGDFNEGRRRRKNAKTSNGIKIRQKK